MKYTVSLKSFFNRLAVQAQDTRIYTFSEEKNFRDISDAYNAILDVLDMHSMASTDEAHELAAFYVDVSNYVYPNDELRRNFKIKKHFEKEVNGRVVHLDIEIHE